MPMEGIENETNVNFMFLDRWSKTYVKKELYFMIFLKSARKPLIKEALEH